MTGLTLMPVLPFIEDTQENIRAIVNLAHASGARYILPAFGMTLRDRQRAYYYDKLDHLFPGLRGRMRKLLGNAIPPRTAMPGVWYSSFPDGASNSVWPPKCRSLLPRSACGWRKSNQPCFNSTPASSRRQGQVLESVW